MGIPANSIPLTDTDYDLLMLLTSFLLVLWLLRGVTLLKNAYRLRLAVLQGRTVRVEGRVDMLDRPSRTHVQALLHLRQPSVPRKVPFVKSTVQVLGVSCDVIFGTGPNLSPIRNPNLSPIRNPNPNPNPDAAPSPSTDLTRLTLSLTLAPTLTGCTMWACWCVDMETVEQELNEEETFFDNGLSEVLGRPTYNPFFTRSLSIPDTGNPNSSLNPNPTPNQVSITSGTNTLRISTPQTARHISPPFALPLPVDNTQTHKEIEGGTQIEITLEDNLIEWDKVYGPDAEFARAHLVLVFQTHTQKYSRRNASPGGGGWSLPLSPSSKKADPSTPTRTHISMSPKGQAWTQPQELQCDAVVVVIEFKVNGASSTPSSPNSNPRPNTNTNLNHTAQGVMPIQAQIIDTLLLVQGCLFAPSEVYGLEMLTQSVPDEEQQRGNEDETTCVVCMTEQKMVALLPCRHLCVCMSCFAQIDKCPVCRANFERYITVGMPPVAGSSTEPEVDPIASPAPNRTPAQAAVGRTSSSRALLSSWTTRGETVAPEFVQEL